MEKVPARHFESILLSETSYCSVFLNGGNARIITKVEYNARLGAENSFFLAGIFSLQAMKRPAVAEQIGLERNWPQHVPQSQEKKS